MPLGKHTLGLSSNGPESVSYSGVFSPVGSQWSWDTDSPHFLRSDSLLTTASSHTEYSQFST